MKPPPTDPAARHERRMAAFVADYLDSFREPGPMPTPRLDALRAAEKASEEIGRNAA